MVRYIELLVRKLRARVLLSVDEEDAGPGNRFRTLDSNTMDSPNAGT